MGYLNPSLLFFVGMSTLGLIFDGVVMVENHGWRHWPRWSARK